LAAISCAETMALFVSLFSLYPELRAESAERPVTIPDLLVLTCAPLACECV
jgi:hypothetical protein